MSSSSSASLGAVSCPINSNTFPGKLWKLVNGGRFQSIGWSNAGTCVAINGTTFKNEVLYNEEFSVFKTQNFSSFVRQLNLYGFRKLAAVSTKESMSGEDVHHFQNPFFNRNRPELLGHVRRAGNRRRGGSENAENSYFTTIPYNRFGHLSSGCRNSQTLFHHQGATYAPVKSEPLHDIHNRFSPYQQTPFTTSTVQPNCYGPSSWSPSVNGAGVGGLHGLTLIASTVSGSLTATCPAEPRQVDFPTLFNQQGQLKKFVVIQEADIGQSFMGSVQNPGGISLSRCNDPLLTTNYDPMLCAIPQPSPPHHPPTTSQAFIMSPTPSNQSGLCYNLAQAGHSGLSSDPQPLHLASSVGQGVPVSTTEVPIQVYTNLAPIVSVDSQLQHRQQVCLPQVSSGEPSGGSSATVSEDCGNIEGMSNVCTSTGV
ncbi:uncharacterized protein [Asterias amurensis]|uniref:uncharacterized protein n=1 Tax=Asterias amurensis TaxID=7602 RepID=UPI003AB60AEC